MFATLWAASPCTHHKELLGCKESSPHWGGTADIGSGYRSVFCSGGYQGTSVAVPWKMTYHVTPPSCLVNRERLVTRDGIKPNFWPKRRQKCPLPRPTSERCNSHKPTSFQALKMPGKATGTVRVRFTSKVRIEVNDRRTHWSRNVTQFRCFEISPGIV